MNLTDGTLSGLLALAVIGAFVTFAKPGGGKESRDAGGSQAGTVRVRLSGPDGKPAEALEVERVVRTEAEWKARLSPEQYRILRAQGTEAAFCGGLLHQKEPGIYACAGCGLPLFSSTAKFESGTGWPSFYEPFARENVAEREDRSLGMVRREILCARCDAHLGHVFEDGPGPTGLRYCLNSAALAFAALTEAKSEKATFAAGCFWHVEEEFRKAKGVVSTRVGYTGGTKESPTYLEVCSHGTGHAEAVEVTFDPGQVGYDQLLDLFWTNHDPTSKDRQGPDVGPQYRSAIFFHTPQQEAAARASLARREASGAYSRPIATRIELAARFWRAEEYHQQYLEKKGKGNRTS